MRSGFRWGTAVAALALAGAACNSETMAPAAGPALSQQGADASGAVVVRGVVRTFLAHLDAERGLLAIHAPPTLCGAGSFNTAEAQFVTTSSEIAQFIAQLRTDDEAIGVYAAATFADAGMVGSAETAGLGGIVDVGAFCAFLEGPALLASGSVRRVSTFSNASFAAHWTGMLTASDGSPVKLTELYQLSADADDPNNPAGWSVNASMVRLGD